MILKKKNCNPQEGLTYGKKKLQEKIILLVIWLILIKKIEK